MIGLVLVTHGRLADEFVTAMEHVVGRQEQVATIAIGRTHRPSTSRALEPSVATPKTGTAHGGRSGKGSPRLHDAVAASWW